MKIFSLFFFLLFSLTTTQTFAADFTVNQITDQHDANVLDGICDLDLATAEPECTLRAAIEQANAIGSNDRVLFNLPDFSTITLTTAGGGEMQVAGTLEIIGSGANRLTINGGAGQNRIFYTNLATVIISGVTLTGGDGAGKGIDGFGGAIFADDSTLTLDSVYVTGNTAGNTGSVRLRRGTNHKIINSTFSANRTQDGGSCGNVTNENSTLTVINSTFSGNTTSGAGGGFCGTGNTKLRNVTITGNSAIEGGGGGIHYDNGTLDIGNSIVAGNMGRNGVYWDPGDAGPDFRVRSRGIIQTMGFNFIGNNFGTGVAFPAGILNSSDIVGTRSAPLDPMLAALAGNGGTTPTHALLSGSPLIDRGDNSLAVDPLTNLPILTDQRGLSRFVDGDRNGTPTVDIGAYEQQLIPLRPRRRTGGRFLSGYE